MCSVRNPLVTVVCDYYLILIPVYILYIYIVIVYKKNFSDRLVQKANLGYDDKNTVAKLSQMSILQPRGRYNLDMSRDMLVLHGKTNSFPIKYDNIQRVFLLPLPNNFRILVVNI